MIETIETPLDALSRLAESRSDSLVGLGTLAALIMARIAGLVFALPGWQSGVFPVRLRLAGVLVATWLVLPVVAGRETGGPELSDLDGAALAGRILVEAVIGGVLGLGVLTIMAGLRGAGEIVDRQTGWGLAGVMDPSGAGGGPGTTLVAWTAVAALFVMAPINGHLLLVDSLLGTFDAIAPGGIAPGDGVVLAPTASDLVVRLVHQSLVLTVQVAAPVLAVMLLVSVAIGLVGRVLPETNVLVVAMPARVLVGVCLLGVVVTGVGRAMTDAVPGVLHEVQATLNGVTPR
ncbi:MAG: flagellar biosynthetic protein FliR [Planctomycetota bacterium]|nr:flagellar biosynthetic protein FliR [Planctomycetota bacterium]